MMNHSPGRLMVGAGRLVNKTPLEREGSQTPVDVYLSSKYSLMSVVMSSTVRGTSPESIVIP